MSAKAMHEINIKALAENDLVILCKAYCDTDPRPTGLAQKLKIEETIKHAALRSRARSFSAAESLFRYVYC